MVEKLCVAMLGSYPLDGTHLKGGVQAAYVYLVNGLARTGELNLHVLMTKPSGYSGPEHFTESNLTIHFLPQYPRFERLRNYVTYQKIVNRTLSQIRPDLIHAQDAGADALVAQRSGFPTVVTVHGIRWEDGKHASSWSQRMRVYYDSVITEQAVMRHARYVIAISPYVARYFKDVVRSDVQLFDVPNAIDEDFFTPNERAYVQIILFAGRVIPRKRVMDLVQAFFQVLDQAPSARLRIAGEVSTEPEYAESIRRWVHEKQLDEKVVFLGPLSEEVIRWEFSQCTMLVLPSAQETAPMVIAQAMAAAKPVIATRVGGVAEMVGEDSSRGVLVNVGDVPGLANAITRVLQNPEEQQRMGENGRTFARQNFLPERVARKTIDAYRYIAGKEQKGHV